MFRNELQSNVNSVQAEFESELKLLLQKYNMDLITDATISVIVSNPAIENDKIEFRILVKPENLK